jgi:flagellar motor switch protein FliN/FliY
MQEGVNSKEASSRRTPEAERLKPDETDRKTPAMNLDLILDIPVTVSIELGRTRLVVEEILQLGQGSVVELDKLAGEPFEVLVQGRPIGKGEVVVVNEKFGIRLTDIISPAERIESLG